MSNRWRHLLGEVWRFFAVAQAATWVSFLLFNVALHGWLVGDPLLEDQAIPAYVIANSIGMIISYHGARGWVFPHRPPRQADGGWTAYVVINVAAMALPVGCLAISRHVLGLDDALSDNLSANGIGLVLAFGARFYLFRRFVFRRPREPVGSATSVV
ncbi:GtrA family protein [Nocardioides sp.]|uniref:GtrA family protein n=1 Tax=Nocardioides sp. TaxID=35761 RepID=UPI002B273FDD|nr:GtrA family protein [Nocardioides sp.]